MKNNVIYTIEEDQILNTQIKVNVACYPLREYQFKKLIENTCRYRNWSINFFFLSLGTILKAIIIFFFIIYELSRNNIDSAQYHLSKIDAWEIGTILLSLFLSLIFYGMSKYITTDRSKLIDELKSFFKKCHDER